MQHAILLGEHDLTIDDKSRLLIPIDVRKAILPGRDGEFLYLIVGPANRKPWLYPQKVYEAIVSRTEPGIAPDPDELEFRQMYFSMATPVEWDKQGRIVVPGKILQRTGTGREVTMIGAGDHLEIWNRNDWEVQFERNLARMGELSVKMNQARKATNQ